MGGRRLRRGRPAVRTRTAVRAGNGAEAAGFSLADIHAQLGGPDKRERPVAPLPEADIRALADRADCDAFIDGGLSATRDPQTGALTECVVSLRVFLPRQNQWAAPDARTFRAFTPDDRPETLDLDYDLFIALQYQLCEALFDVLGADPPLGWTTDRCNSRPPGPPTSPF